MTNDVAELRGIVNLTLADVTLDTYRQDGSFISKIGPVKFSGSTSKTNAN